MNIGGVWLSQRLQLFLGTTYTEGSWKLDLVLLERFDGRVENLKLGPQL